MVTFWNTWLPLSLLAVGIAKIAWDIRKKKAKKRATEEHAVAAERHAVQPSYSLTMTNSKLSYNNYAWGLKHKHKLIVDLCNSGEVQITLARPAWFQRFDHRADFQYPEYRYRFVGKTASGEAYEEQTEIVLTPNQSCVLWLAMPAWDAEFQGELFYRRMLGQLVIPVRIPGQQGDSKSFIL